ncbi:MAG: hypothetical protein C5B59_03580 [Bacteroidetes bacterium]|nr:MAG: hypothetical protein C5B59_03580 [Bacteroidota bacterium]
MRTITSLLLSLSVICFSCGPSTKATVIGTYVNKEKVQPGQRKVKKVFINVMTQDELAKSVMENDLADAAAKKGIPSEKSYYVFGPVRTKENLPPKDLVLQNIRKLGCDAIFIVVLMDVKSETHYTPSSTLYSPYPYYGYYGTFGAYYYNSAAVYTPGYYTTEHTYYLESNLYDASTEDLLVSMQTKVVNPQELEKSSELYTKALVEELEKQGFMQKKK